MSISTATALVDQLRLNRLLPAKQLDELAPVSRGSGNDPRHLARQLVQRGWLTPFQINQLFMGQGQQLVLGHYVLLERLGEGGMGQVYKARQQRLGRLVALKVIRKDRADHPDVVRRFLREVQAVAQLVHPNIVLAFDADQFENTYFIAMEYIEGIDLDRYVKRSGPLTVEHACTAIKQAALGLQHAHEHGLVHRDIKPSNLIWARTHGTPGLGLVKILDLGLARLHMTADHLGAPAPEGSDPLTRPGMVIGTPDYVAPEQALDAHTADIRADLYSLGCTMHFLLTGHSPFPGRKPLEKLICHRYENPPPVESLRPDVPPEVGAVVRTLMAKDPRQRYQTPAQLAATIDSLADVIRVAAGNTPVNGHAFAPLAALVTDTPGAHHAGIPTQPEIGGDPWAAIGPPAAPRPLATAPPRWVAQRALWLWLIGFSILAVWMLAGLITVLRSR